MYDAELMMAVLIACTTFIGLTGVVIVQITTSKYPSYARRQFCKYVLLASLLLGISVILTAIGWFEKQYTVSRTLSSYLFGLQIGLFICGSFISWGVIK